MVLDPVWISFVGCIVRTIAGNTLAFGFALLALVGNLYSQDKLEEPRIFQYEFSREEIEGLGYKDLIQVLEYAPGASVSKTMLGFDRLALRGLRSDSRLQVRLNGARIQNAYNGLHFWGIDNSFLGTVNLLYGPGIQNRYANATEGVVEASTREIDGFYLEASGGSFSSISINSGGGFKTKHWDFALLAAAYTTEGPKLPIARDRYGFFSKKSPLAKTHASEDSFAVATKLEYASLSDADFTLSLSSHCFMESRSPYIGPYDTVSNASRLRWINWGSKLLAGVSPAKEFQVEFTLEVHGDVSSGKIEWAQTSRISKNVEQKQNPSIFGEESYKTLGIEAGVVLKNQFGQKHLLTSTVTTSLSGILKDTYSYKVAGKNSDYGNLSDVQGLPSKHNQVCTPWQINQNIFGSCRAELNVSFSYRWLPFSFLGVEGGVTLYEASDIGFEVARNTLPYLMLFTAFGSTTISLSYREGYRLPTLEEKYQTGTQAFAKISPGISVGNTDLIEEKSRTIELNLSILGDNNVFYWDLEASGYFQSTSNAIETIDFKGDLNTLLNSGTIETLGIDFSLKLHFSAKTYFFINLGWFRSNWKTYENGLAVCNSFFDSADKSKCSLLTNLPQMNASLGGQIDTLVGKFFVATRLHSERRNNMRSMLEVRRPYQIPSYFSLDLNYISAPLWEVLRFKFDISNLFDVKFQDEVPRPDLMPDLLPRGGIEIYAGVSLDF